MQPLISHKPFNPELLSYFLKIDKLCGFHTGYIVMKLSVASYCLHKLLDLLFFNESKIYTELD